MGLRVEIAGYVEIKKEFVDKIPRTLLKITEEGKKAFQSYRQNMTLFFGELPD